jgi:hypothetical protein
MKDVGASMVAAQAAEDVLPLVEHNLAQVPLAVLVKAAFATEEGTYVPIPLVRAVPGGDGDQLLDPVGAEVRVGTGVDVSTHPVVLNEAGTSSLRLVATACDDALRYLTVVGATGDMSTVHGANGNVSAAYRGDSSRTADSSDRGTVVFAVTSNQAVNGTTDSVMDARGADDGLSVAQSGQGSSSGEAIRRAHDTAGATSHQEVESSKDDIAVVHRVGGDLSVAQGGDGSGGADDDVEADAAFGAAMNPTAEGMIVDIGAVHEVDAAPVESAVPPIPYSPQSAASVAPGGWADIIDQACMAIDTMVLLANGEYRPVQNLAGRMVADTNGGTTLVNRVHRFYLHNPTHRLVLFKGNWITEGHYIKRPAGEYHIWVPSAEDNHQHGPLPGMWTQADGRQWWHEGSFRQAQPLSIPPICEDSRFLYGEAVFNIELSKPAGVFLLGGLEVATLGNGVFLKDAHPTYHAALFEELTRTLRRLHMQHQAVISWAPGAISTSELGTQSLDHSRIIVPTVIMAHWERQPHISTFQRSFIEGTTFELQQYLLERARAAGAELPDPPIYTRHTWLEEMHDWLQTNALATSLVMLNTRMETMSSPLSSDFEGQADVTHPSCLAVVIQGVLIGRFGVAPNIRICDLISGLKEGIRSGFNLDRFRTIWPHDHLFEAARDKSLVAHERFLDCLLREDFTLGTHQGPMLPFHRLSGYVWEDTKLVHLIPSLVLPANRPQAWWTALKMAPPVAHGPWTHNTLSNSETMPIRQLPVSVTLLPGAVIRIHSLLTATHLNGRVALILFRDNVSNRLAIRLRGFRAFQGTTVLVQEQNLSFLWWGTPPAGWDEWRTGQAVNLTGCPEDRFVKTAQGTSSCGGHRSGDVVIIHSIPTTSVGIHVNGCRATLLAPVTLNLLGDECWEALLHDGNLALPSAGGGRIVLPLHQMTAKSLFLGMHWGRLARATMASRIDSFEQPANPDLTTAQYSSVDQPTQPPPPSGGGGPQ